MDGRRAGERDRVHPAVAHRVDQPQGRPDLVGPLPAVDRHLDHLGPRVDERVHCRPVALAVVLERDRPPRERLGPQPVDDVLEPLALGAGPHVEAGGVHGCRGLGATGRHLRAGQRVEQALGQAPGLHGLEPGPDADAGGCQEVVGTAGDDSVGGRPQGLVAGQVLGLDGRTVHHHCAPPLEQLGLLGPAAIRGDADHSVPRRPRRTVSRR